MREDGFNPRRRWALEEIGRKALGLTGIAAGLGTSESAAQAPDRERLERERAIERELAAYRQHIQSNYDKLSTGDAADTNTPLNAAFGRELRVTPAQLEGTKFDTKELENKYPYMIATRTDSAGKVIGVTLIPPGDKYIAERFGAASQGYANGFFISEDTFVTNEHVLGAVRGDSSTWFNQPRDVAILKLPSGWKVPLENVVPADMLVDIGARELSGLMGVCASADPDQTSDIRGNKTYLGGLISVVPTKLRESLARVTHNDYFNRFLSRSIAMRIPLGESREVADPTRGGHVARRAAGKSGSPLFVWYRNRWVLGGVFWGVDTVWVPAVTGDVDAGFSISGITSARSDTRNHHTLPSGIDFEILNKP